MTSTPRHAFCHPLARPLCRWPWLCAALLAACSQAGVKGQSASDANGGSENENTPGSVGSGTLAPLRGVVGGPGNHYTLVGRFDSSQGDQVSFAFANSKVGARFSGTQTVSVSLAGDGNDTYQAVLDDANGIVLAPNASMQPNTLLIASGLDPTVTHTLWFIKRTEGYATANDGSEQHTGTASFFGFLLDGAGAFQDPPQTYARLIEAIGDSGFTGYGDANVSAPGAPTCVFTPASEDATQSVPALTATLLGAEVMNISAAGKGIYTSVYQPDPNEQIPQLYLQTLPPNVSPAYAFGGATVDAVIVQGGSNDLAGAYGSGTLPDPNAFIASYTSLLATIRQYRPSAPILCAVSPSADGNDIVTLTTAMNAAVANRAAAGDTQVSVYNFFTGDANGWTTYSDASYALGLGSGCEGHPSPAGAAFLSARLANAVRAAWSGE